MFIYIWKIMYFTKYSCLKYYQIKLIIIKGYKIFHLKNANKIFSKFLTYSLYNMKLNAEVAHVFIVFCVKHLT